MKMGCCFSCNEDDDQNGSQSGENERRPLIDPVSNTAPVVTIPRSDSLTVATMTGQSVRGQEDELAKILQETASAMIDVSCSGSHSLDQREFQERSRTYLHKIQTLSPALLLNPQPIQAEPASSAATLATPCSPNLNTQNASSGTPVASSPASSTLLASGSNFMLSAADSANTLINPSRTTGVGGFNLLLGDVPNPEKHLGTELISEEDKELMNFAMDEIEEALHSIRVEFEDDLVVPFGSEYSQPSSPSSDRMVMVSPD